MTNEKIEKTRVHMPRPDEIVTVSEGLESILTGMQILMDDFVHVLTKAEKNKMVGAAERIVSISETFAERANKAEIKQADAEKVALVKDLTAEEIKELLALKEKVH